MADDIQTQTPANEQSTGAHISEETPAKPSTQTQAPVLDPAAEPKPEPKEAPKDEPKDAPAGEDKDKPANDDKKTLGEGVNPDDVVPIDHEDVNIRAVQSILADAKVTEADAFKIFGKAVESLNLADVDMKALTEKVGEAKAQLVVAGMTQWYNTVAAGYIATQQAVHKAFGGEQGWEAAKSFFQSKESDPAVKELKGMLDKGGIHAELAIERMVKMYTSDPNTKTGQLPVNIQTVQTGNGPTQIIADKKEFVALLNKCRTIEERQAVQRNWLDSKRSRGEL